MSLTLANIIVHFFSDKENEPKKSPAHALFTLSKIKIYQQRSKLARLKQ